MRPTSSLSSLPKVALKTVPMFVWLNTDRSQLQRVNVGCFLSPLLFPPGDQCCDALACPCSESSSSFLHSSFLQAISAVMLWPVHVQKVPQTSEHQHVEPTSTLQHQAPGRVATGVPIFLSHWYDLIWKKIHTESPHQKV